MTTKKTFQWLASAELDAIFHGAKFRFHLEGGSDPQAAIEELRAADPDVKFQTEFFTRGGGRGRRDAKTAKAYMIQTRSFKDAVGFTLLAKDEDDKDIQVAVGRKQADKVVDFFVGAGLEDSLIVQLKTAVEQKASAVILIGVETAVEIQYWTTDDGNHFWQIDEG